MDISYITRLNAICYKNVRNHTFPHLTFDVKSDAYPHPNFLLWIRLTGSGLCCIIIGIN
jgi:hypothetical protein